MEKYKNYIDATIFLVIFFILLNITSYLFVPKNNLEEFGMEQITANGVLGEKENTIDILFLGDSEVYTSIIPMEFFNDYGITSYVCGTSGQRLYDSYRFLEAALEYQNPKMVVLETNAIYRKYTLMSAIQAKSKLLFPVIKYHDRWKHLSINDFGGDINYTWTDDNKGYIKKDQIAASLNPNYMEKEEGYKNIMPLNYRQVVSIKNICDQKGIKFMLMSSPSSINWNYQKHNGIKRLADNLDVPYIDLNLIDSLKIDWAVDTLDKGDHLNYTGALKVSKYMGVYFHELGLFDNHFADPVYSDWHKALDNYKKRV